MNESRTVEGMLVILFLISRRLYIKLRLNFVCNSSRCVLCEYIS